MDADRRRKTVIAGTFAIERKSVSNSRPISAGEMQRPKAEMTVTSTRCQRFTKPAPGSSLVATARSSKEGAGWGPLSEIAVRRRRGAKLVDRSQARPTPPHICRLRSLKPNFCFPPENLEPCECLTP
jgi:hypothetical protein